MTHDCDPPPWVDPTPWPGPWVDPAPWWWWHGDPIPWPFLKENWKPEQMNAVLRVAFEQQVRLLDARRAVLDAQFNLQRAQVDAAREVAIAVQKQLG